MNAITPVPRCLPALTVRTIQLHVSQHYGMSVAEMMGDCHRGELVRPRHIAIWLARRLTRHSLPALGRMFERDHSTIKYAVVRIEELRRGSESFRRLTDHIGSVLETSHAVSVPIDTAATHAADDLATAFRVAALNLANRNPARFLALAARMAGDLNMDRRSS